MEGAPVQDWRIETALLKQAVQHLADNVSKLETKVSAQIQLLGENAREDRKAQGELIDKLQARMIQVLAEERARAEREFSARQEAQVQREQERLALEKEEREQNQRYREKTNKMWILLGAIPVVLTMVWALIQIGRFFYQATHSASP